MSWSSFIMMTQTIKITRPSEIRRSGTEALFKTLEPIGMARYLEVFDNGGTGDYTKEKYEQPDYTIQEILNTSKTALVK